MSIASTLVWVAMPAWSMPGTQQVWRPRIFSKRIRMSCSVLFRMWPRVSMPVTFGGGMTMVYGTLVLSTLPLKYPRSSHFLYHLASTSEGAYALDNVSSLMDGLYLDVTGVSRWLKSPLK